MTAGQDADAGSEQRTTQQRRRMAKRLPHAREDASGFHAAPRQVGDDVVTAHKVEKFRRREQADDRRNDRDAVEQEIEPERAARRTAHAEANRAEQQAEDAREKPARKMTPAQARDQGQSPQRHDEHLRRAEPERERRDRLREAEQQQIGGSLTDAGGRQRQAQCLVVATGLRHRKPVEGGADRRRRTGYVEQHRRNCHAEQRTRIHRCHENERLQEIHVRDQRQADRQRHRCRQARHRMDHQPDQDAGDDHQPGLPGTAEKMQGGGEGVRVDHDASFPKKNSGSGVARIVPKQ